MWNYYESDLFQKAVRILSTASGVLSGLYFAYLYQSNTNPKVLGGLITDQQSLGGLIIVFIVGYLIGAGLMAAVLLIIPVLLLILLGAAIVILMASIPV